VTRPEKVLDGHINARLQPRRLIIALAAVGCKRLILIQASPCDLPIIGRLSQG
jgi:hypothetical protein